MWRVVVTGHANRAARRFPAGDRERIARAVAALTQGPFQGDTRKLVDDGYRLRVGSYRVFFTADFERREITVTDIVRRTSTTY